MNKKKLIALCHKISNEKKLPFNTILNYYFLENILLKLSKSNYNDKFIFNGGFLLSNIIGIETRSTVDIDYREMKFSRKFLNRRKILKNMRNK